MSAEAVGWVWKHSPMEKSGLLVHLALADVTNDMHGNQLWCSVATLAKKTRLDRTTVMRVLGDLVEQFLLDERQRPGKTTLYQFRMPLLPVVNSDTLSDMPVAESDTGVAESDTTRRNFRHELNRTQANNPAPAEPIFTNLDDFEYLQHDQNPEALSTVRDRFKQRADLA